MRKITAVAVLFLMTGTFFHASAETPKLETLFAAGQLPFTKLEEGRYFAVVTVDQESERFQVVQSSLGNDSKETALQFIMLYFKLGELPQGNQIPAALAKQMNTWNANLTAGKVVIYDKGIFYKSFLWLDRTDADALVREAVVGHLNSQDLRKELAPYLKP